MGERDVIISNIIEEVDFLFFQEKTGSDGMHRCITPTFVEESTILIEGLKIVEICLRTEPVQVTNFKIGPLSKKSIIKLLSNPGETYHMAMVIRVSSIVTEEAHRVTLGDVFRVCFHELFGAIPQRRNRLDVFVQAQHETVLLLVFGHELENVIVDIAEKLNAWLDTPVPFVVVH
jgi:hypothetical protein